MELYRNHRLLMPGDLFISKTVCKPGKGAPFKFRFLGLFVTVMQLLGEAPFVRFMDVQEPEDLVSSCGFKILESGDHPAPSRVILAHKLLWPMHHICCE